MNLPDYVCNFERTDGIWYQVIAGIKIICSDDYAIMRLNNNDVRPDKFKVKVLNLGGMSRGKPYVIYEDDSTEFAHNRILFAYKRQDRAYRKCRELNIEWRTKFNE